jgi:hypothetical protein
VKGYHTNPSGDVITSWYKGARGQEYLFAKEFSNAPGVIHRYTELNPREGPPPLSAVEYPDGTILHYEGPPGSEKVVWEETPDGQWIER